MSQLQLGVYRTAAAALIVVYDVYQYMRSGPRAQYPYEGTLWHPVLVSLDACVGWFFLLSALLVGLPYARSALAGDAPAPPTRFLSRRVVRVVPLYVVAVLIVWTLRNDTVPGDWRDLVEHLTFTQVFDDKRIFFTIGPAWALAVEVQFYVLLAVGATALCARCRRLPTVHRRLGLLTGAIAGMAAVSVLWKLVAWYGVGVDETTWWVWFGLPAKLDIFAIGLMLAVVVAVRGTDVTSTRSFRAKLRLGGLAITVIAVVARSHLSMPPSVYFHTVTALGFGMIVAAAVMGPSTHADRAPFGARLPSTTSVVALGITSYSLYLWHEPVMLALASHGLYPDPGKRYSFVLGVAILLPLASLVAWISYWAIEYPTSMVRRTREATGERRDYYDDR